ncbi:AAA family ATPase [Jiella sp. MQZ9-1]|uniref:non-specific protein-tyrosine kinase n=1 Tax=Jiella flava TaxID=2816857 RepID=A0A939FVZ3_9HYPH|nr:Wzz/FepE/Etk N-terminal domain-containing protein [Jiella flava]MBO0662460.1 AAA family ATPase [Jiella flava]MCD2471685.1 AAA family ATPase [Jiella flava]
MPTTNNYEPYLAEESFNLDDVFAIIRRQFWLVGLFTLLGAFAGAGYLAIATPFYTASAQVLIDGKEAQSTREEMALADVAFDDTMVNSELEVLQSRKLAETVLDQLDLLDDPRFNDAPAGLAAWIKSAVMALVGEVEARAGLQVSALAVAEPNSRGIRIRRTAVERLLRNLTVTRVSQTHVINIAYRSPNAHLSADIANAYAKVYIEDRLESDARAMQRVGHWLQRRIADAENSVSRAEAAIQTFRQAHDRMSSNGELLSDQQLTTVNGQLVAAQADANQAAAHYLRIKDIIDKKEMDAAVSETLDSPVISDLRNRYLEAAKQYQDIVTRLGPKHMRAVQLETDMQQYRELIFDELKRIAEVSRSDLAVAQSRVVQLQAEMQKLAGATAAATDTQMRLRELERNATNLRSMRDTLIAHYDEMSARDSFPIPTARVLTEAVPGSESSPKAAMVLSLGLFLGALSGGGLGALTEYRDRVFRTGDQVRDELSVNFLGMLHLLRPADVMGQMKDKSVVAVPPGEEGLPIVHAHDPMLRQSFEAPFTGFAETLRATKIACDLAVGGKAPKVIGVASMLPNEGKTTVSKNLASLIARGGTRVLLIDADLRNPGLTAGALSGVHQGLIEVLLEQLNWRDLLCREAETGLHILPTLRSRAIHNTGDLLASPAMQQVVADAVKEYDYVLLDLPPLGAVVDARAAAHLFDTLVFVAEWGKTDRKLMRDAFDADPRLPEMCAGVLFNKVDAKQLRRYKGQYYSNYYYEYNQ